MTARVTTRGREPRFGMVVQHDDPARPEVKWLILSRRDVDDGPWGQVDALQLWGPPIVRSIGWSGDPGWLLLEEGIEP